MATEEDLARLAEQVQSLEASVGRFDQLARLVLEVVPSAWLIQELASRMPDDEDPR